MKKMLFTITIFLAAFSSEAQNVAISNNGATADPTAILDIISHDKGVLIPRLRTTERMAIAVPVQGLLAYDIDTHSFWYFDVGSWKEIFNSGNPVTPGGIAGGNLSGNYPNPTVAKIQNLDVSSVFPFDKQVMKWDAINNTWQGLNDSLFLPYNVTFGSPTKLFGITNANTTAGSSAIYGKSGNSGSGITPANTAGVWGDNSTGSGVVGTSNTGQGIFGFSFNNNGVQGYSVLAGMAGVYGSNANANGIGVMGEIQNNGFAIYGKSTGTTGKAGWFQNTNLINTDTTLKVSTAGIGRLSSFNITNGSNTNPAIDIYHDGNGKGLQVYLNNNVSTSNAIDAVTNGNGIAVYGKSEAGIAGKFEITNTFSPGTALYVATAGLQPASQFVINNSNSFNALINGTSNGKGNGIYLNMSNASNSSSIFDISGSGTGRGLDLSLSNQSNNSHALYVNTEGIGSAGFFNANNSTNAQPALKVKQNGTGRGLEAIISNNTNNSAAVYANSSGSSGVQAYAKTTGILGQSTGLTGGIGVLGQSALNSNDGIGVKGESYSNVTTSGSITGINHADGIAIYGNAASVSGNGIAVYGSSNTPPANQVASITGVNTGGGYAVEGNSSGPSASGVHGFANPSGISFGVGVVGQSFNYGDGVRGFGGGAGNGVSGFAENGGTGAGIYGASSPNSNTGRAAYFETAKATNTYEAVRVNNAGLAATLSLTATNANNTTAMVRVKKGGTGDYIVFEDGTGINKIRFDNTGKGFFNGGTQVGGADMAEAFDITDDINKYEAGDVLIISVDKDRTIEKSNGAYSNLVAGVYATKPGVLMSEENIDANLGNKVPMGVLGVIPTKVCMEGGEIKRGDQLVSSSIAGVAMKGDTEKIKPGQVIGKALENYSGNGVVKIRVLVNCR